MSLGQLQPTIPGTTYEARVAALVERAAGDWVVVYADREHLANIAFLIGFEPRFEEALLLLGRGGERIIVTGNESMVYLPVTRHRCCWQQHKRSRGDGISFVWTPFGTQSPAISSAMTSG